MQKFYFSKINKTFTARKKYLVIVLFFLCSPLLVFSTHIVGGSLTYVYNGGSNYTITLKLYRDCGPGTAGIPASVTIQITDINGNPFTPSKNVTINLTSVSNIAPVFDPCAIPPNPTPCVQEAIYTTNVTNLPPNPGGYHMYFQICCRNGSILNITNPGSAGETFYANIPGMTLTNVWNENFTLPNNTTTDNGATSWNSIINGTAPTSFGVNTNLFQVVGANNAGMIWTSQVVDISSCPSTNLSVNLSETGTMDANDSILVYYRLNGGSLIPFPVNGFRADDFTSTTATANNLVGSTIQIVIRTRFDGNSPNSEIYSFDNIIISCVANDFKTNSNPVFDLFPPLFICVNKPFTFDHSATDANGDSLVYSLYQPYNSVAPTFPGGVATFPPVTYVGGYNALNPLGAGPFSVNSSTGLLSGTPNTLGQFVVGVKVREFRNGVYIGETIRDFQFNVVNCPEPPPSLAVPNATINTGCIAKPVATGITSVSATWKSIFPGAPGAYNNYLACTSGCLSNTVNPIGTPPAFIDFVVCGIATSCSGAAICDTFRVYFNPTLAVNIFPSNPTLCFGQTSTTLTAIGTGGTPPYTYLWNNVNPSQTINVGLGTYNIQLSDASGCAPVYNSVAVTAFSLTINANAGPNQTKCIQSPLATLNGSITGATGGIWSGGSGTFSPNNTTLSSLTYSPSAAEIAGGFVNLILTTTGNGSCPSKTDTVRLSYLPFTGIATPSVTNVSCFGGSNGTANINLSGGISPYSYLWNTVPTRTTSSISNLPIGTYSVTIKDSIGCTFQTAVTINQPPILATSASVDNVKCFGASTGSITLSASGGTIPYTYSWSPGGQTTSSITALSSGSYTGEITDANGCTNISSYTITQPTPITYTLSPTNVSCFNGFDGAVNTTVSGGTSPYIFQWLPGGSTSQNATGLTAGNYSLTITDNFNCSVTTTVAITQPNLLVATTNITNETCNYLNNGSATVIPTGGTAPYSYLWQSGGQTTASITNRSSGTYTVTVTDSKGCPATAVVTINEPTPLAVSFVNQINVSCFGENTGSIGASPSGGTPNYTYSWTPGGATTNNLINISAGTYTVSIKDINNCLVQNTITISQPTAPLVVSLSSSSITCNGGTNGSVTSIAFGGTPTYSYNMVPGFFTTSTVPNLSSGTYTVTATDLNGCSATNTVFVNQPAPILPITTSTNSTCGNANGIGSVSVTGGVAPYTYSWMPSGGTNSVTSNLSSGLYSVKVTDAKNCTIIESLSINDNGGPIASIYSIVDVSCNGGSDGSATASIIGGTGPVTYTWLPTGGNGTTAINLTAGFYTIVAVDANGCVSKAITSPAVNEPSPITETILISNVSCFAGTDGSASVTAWGGTPGYTYTWLPSLTTGSVVSGLSSGTYSVQVKDINNCIHTVPYSISQPSALVASITSTDVSCFGGNNGIASASATGGTTPYSFNWMPMSVNGSTIGGLSIGTYTVNVTDFKNCSATKSITISQPTLALSATVSSVPTSCSGISDGSATVTPVGGTAGYTYIWSPSGGVGQTANSLNPGTYIVSVNDTKNCQTNVSVNITSPSAVTGSLSVINAACGLANGSISSQISGGVGPYTYTWSPITASSSNVVGLMPNTYTLSAADSFGCIKTLTTTLIGVPSPSLALTSTLNDSCYGGNEGAATINITLGTLPYSINWLPYGGNSTTASQLTAGVYTANVVDARGCISSITANITEPNLLTINLSNITNVSCFGGNNGSITLLTSGGTPSYNYTWLPTGTGAFSGNLSTGTYTVNVVDSHFCSAAISMAITQPSAALTSSISNVVDLLCYNSTGSASSSVSGGTTPYTYNWSTTPPQNTSTATNILSGTYTVNISDANGCISSNTVTLTQPSEIISNSGINDTICFGQQGTLIASATGGSGNYYYVWQPVNITNSGTLTVGPTSNSTYTVVAFDQTGCAGLPNTAKIIVYNLSPSNVQTFGLSPICDGQSSLISVSVSGNSGPITYNWSNGLGIGNGPFIVTPSQPTTYYVDILNSCGVPIRDSVVININPPPTILASFAGTLACVPGSLNFIDNSVTGNVNDPITSWLWDFGDGTTETIQNPSHNYNSPGTYSISLKVTTDGGCTNNNSSTPIVVNAYPNAVASFSVNSTTLNLPYDALNTTNLSTGAVSYNWNFGDGTSSTIFSPSHTYTSIGNFEIILVATTQYGCMDTAKVKITTDADVVFPNAFTPNTNGPSGGYYIPGNLDNDIFFPYTSGVIEYKLQIFNRWGELIFETEDIKQGWDGYYREKICQVGVYIWKAYVKLNNGKEFNKTGDVTLLR